MKHIDRPWTPFYGHGVRPNIEVACHPTLGDLIGSVASTYGSAAAFTTCLPNGMNGTLSFTQVDKMSDALAIYLREIAGLKQGDRVALQMPNCLSFPLAAFAVLKAGCVLVNVNPLYTADEMARQFEDAQPQALIIVDIFADKVMQATRVHKIPHIIISRVADFFPTLPRTIVGLVQKYWDRSVKPIAFSHIYLPQALLAGESYGEAQQVKANSYRVNLGADALACLQYTGGTTGVAKGAMLTHANLILNMEQTMELVNGVEKGQEVALTVLPMYHIFAFTVNLLGFYGLGSRNILIPNPRPLVNLKRAFENYKITWMSGVNTLFNGLVNEVWFTDSPPRQLKYATAGGMALQGAVAKKWEIVTGKPVLQGYGLTETSPVLTFNPLGSSREGSVGIPVPSTDIVCLGDNGLPVPAGEAGEIAVRGPQVMAGYWNKPEETSDVMRGDWFLTGDIGVMDLDGYLSIVDRKKDMIIVSGFNVYPNEIEDCLMFLVGVAEVAVIGVPNAAAGEAVKAFIVRRDLNLTEADVRNHCKLHLTGYKIPKIVEFREYLPKSSVGKVLRKDLRTQQHTHVERE